MSFDHLLADRTRNMGSNAIREILKLLSKPGMVSLAGGIPAAASFPMEAMPRLFDEALARFGTRAFQYDISEGFLPLREALVPFLARRGVAANAESVRITTGSQGALETLGKILISPGDAVAVEAPTYLGALTCFNPFQPRYVSIATDADGMVPEALEEAARRERLKFVYLMPTFQNPTGITLSIDRRRRIAEIAMRHNLLLVEDDPYGDLRYFGEPLPALHSLAPDNTVFLGSFSKIFAPGARVGFAVAPEPIRRWMVLAKQGTDVHTSTVSQSLCTVYLESGELERHLPEIVELYRPRLAAMLAAIGESFPRWMRWSQPEGGMFVWAEAQEPVDMVELAPVAVERNVAYVPGTYFYADGTSGRSTMRLNFTVNDPGQIDGAVRVLGEVLATAPTGARVG